jgi:hypothetical protein
MSKIKIDKKDFNRILLTELLPYEVPMLFSNDGFYQLVTSGKHEQFIDKIKPLRQVYGIPFNYEIAKTNDSDTRTLSIIHPFNQYNFIDFYKKYDSIMLHLCSKSPFSLRSIKKVAKFSAVPDLVFSDHYLKDASVEVEQDIVEYDPQYLKSYFIYQPVDLIYKFYDRQDYQRLEQRYNLLWEFDISKCFYHIYTHSITWAVKDKESAKRNHAIQSLFENRFDKLMQQANYNETNGIVVGPEISRIFAEVLLQQVDLNVINKVASYGFKFGIDYEVRRYVDDIFVFSNDIKILESVFRAFKEELAYYKLYLNPNKTKKSASPFITNIAVGKRQVKKTMSELFTSLIDSDTGQIRQIGRPYSVSQNFIKDIQCIVRINNLTYDVVNRDIIRFFKTRLATYLKNPDLKVEKDNFENFLLMLLDVIFYFYSLNITSNATFKVAQIIVLVTKLLINKADDYKHTVWSKIKREAEFVMTTYHRRQSKNETNIETLNLLLALKGMGVEYLFTEKKIREYFNLDNTGLNKAEDIDKMKNLNYFQIVTLLYYFGNNDQYRTIKTLLERSVVTKFKDDRNPFTKSEMTLLFFDFICCPYTDPANKKTVMVNSSYFKTGNFALEIKKIQDVGTWFFEWNQDIDLEQILKKKEWASTY